MARYGEGSAIFSLAPGCCGSLCTFGLLAGIRFDRARPYCGVSELENFFGGVYKQTLDGLGAKKNYEQHGKI